MGDAPCRGCEKRYPACHDSCEEYKAFKQPFIETNKKRLKAGEIADYYHGRKSRAIRKAQHSRGEK